MELSHKSALNYRPDIDGVRAVAIISVVLFHAGVPMLPGGFTGVDIFFVISGYLIGGHIFSELRSGTFSFLRFYQRRAKRILPAFYFVLAFAFLTALVLLSASEVREFAKGAIASILSVSNILFLRRSNYFQANSEFNILLMTWSLGVEEQFYAVIPLLMVLLARIRRNLLLPAMLVVCVLSFIFAWGELGSHPAMVFYLLPSRAWELGMGVVLAVTEQNWKRKLFSGWWIQIAGVVGTILVLAPMHLLTSAMPFPGATALPSVLGTALVIAASGSWINRGLLSFKPLVFVGRISYSWYLWHWPVLSFMRVTSGGELPPAAVGLGITVSFAAAVFSYYFVEQPFRSSSRAPAPLLLRYAAVSVAFLGVGAALWAAQGFPRRYPALNQEGETALNSCLVDYGGDKPDLSSKCYPSSDPRPSVVLWGDSHSAALAPALRQIAGSHGYNFIQLGKASCLPLKGAAIFMPEHPLVAGECMHFNDAVSKAITADRRIRIVILAGRWSGPFRESDMHPLISDLAHEREIPSADAVQKTFTQSLSALIQPLRNENRHVVIVDDVPNFDFDPLWRFKTSGIAARKAMADWMKIDTSNPGLAPSAYTSAASVATGLLSQTQKKIPGVELIDLSSTLCNSQNMCAYMNGDRLLYADGQHLTADGARYVLREFSLPGL